jgi:N-acetylglucosamine-6-phosphate deacetylase
MDYLVRRARIVGIRKVSQGDILIRDGRIAQMGKVRRPAGARVIEGAGLHALPGFVDIHTHGALGLDLTAGRFDPKRKVFDASPEAYRERLPELMRHYARHGVTRVLLGTVAAPEEALEHCLAQLADYVEDARNGRDGARLEGAMIEGTFIKHPEKAGAQNPANFRAPDKRLFDRLNRAARGHIAYVNVVPEFGKPARDLTRHLAARGVLVGAGHTDCGADDVLRSAQAGLRVAVHFLNGPTGTSFKPFHGGNVVEAVLQCPEICAELICDGCHIAPAYVRDVIERKGIGRIIVVTDAIFAAGMKGIGSFALGGREGQVHAGGQYVHVKGSAQTLFGSVLAMSQAFGNVVSWLTRDMAGIWHARHPALTLDDALLAAALGCATNPARVIGLAAGSLEPGKSADLVLARLTGKPGNWKIAVRHTFVEGHKVL